MLVITEILFSMRLRPRKIDGWQIVYFCMRLPCRLSTSGGTDCESDYLSLTEWLMGLRQNRHYHQDRQNLLNVHKNL